MTAKKAAPKAVDQRTVALVGPSHGAKDGDKRQVDAQLAESLVARRLARYADEA